MDLEDPNIWGGRQRGAGAREWVTSAGALGVVCGAARVWARRLPRQDRNYRSATHVPSQRWIRQRTCPPTGRKARLARAPSTCRPSTRSETWAGGKRTRSWRPAEPLSSRPANGPRTRQAVSDPQRRRRVGSLGSRPRHSAKSLIADAGNSSGVRRGKRFAPPGNSDSCCGVSPFLPLKRTSKGGRNVSLVEVPSRPCQSRRLERARFSPDVSGRTRTLHKCWVRRRVVCLPSEASVWQRDGDERGRASRS